MKIKRKKIVEEEFEVSLLQVDAGVRYWEDASVDTIEDTDGNLIPCRNDSRWQPLIDIETGKILNWEPGKTANIHYKVCDDGTYKLLDSDQNERFSSDGYVPAVLCPNDNGYGDYIIMTVGPDGIIDGWDKEYIHEMVTMEE